MKGIPNADLHIFENSGHNPHEEKTDEYPEVVSRFIQATDTGPNERHALIANTNLIDGLGGAPRGGTSVLIDAGRIAWIGPDEDAPSIGDAPTVDGNGRSLIPGLINSHVHLANDGSPDLHKQVLDDSVPVASLRAAQSARHTLVSGITTVRDCGAANGVVIELGRAVDAGLVEGPRIVAAGRVITMTGGHGHFIGREADGVDAIRTPSEPRSRAALSS